MVEEKVKGGVRRREGGSALASIGRRSLSEEAYRRVRRALTTGELQPGQRLNIREMAEAFGTSATPVREALLQLVTEGVLELRAGRAILVPSPTREAYLELRDMRVALEGLGAARAAEKAVPAAIEKLEGLHEKLVAAKARRDFKAALRWNESFHLALCREAGMPRLLRTVEGLWAQTGPLLNLLYSPTGQDPAPAGIHGHLKVVDALRRRDPDGARQAIVDDIIGGSGDLVQRLPD